MNELVRACEKEEVGSLRCLPAPARKLAQGRTLLFVYLDETMSQGRTLLKAPKNIAREELIESLFFLV